MVDGNILERTTALRLRLPDNAGTLEIGLVGLLRVASSVYRQLPRNALADQISTLEQKTVVQMSVA